MSLQKGVDGPSNDLGVVEMDMVRSWHCTVLVQRVRAVRLHCCSVQLLCVPLLGVCLKSNVIIASCCSQSKSRNLDKKMRTPNVPAELEEKVRRKTVE